VVCGELAIDDAPGSVPPVTDVTFESGVLGAVF
jgi:hypothetical protein